MFELYARGSMYIESSYKSIKKNKPKYQEYEYLIEKWGRGRADNFTEEIGS